MRSMILRSTAVVVLAALLFSATPVSHADTFRPVVRGRRGVVAGGQPLSVEAGMRILQHGGNAVDAGVATILAASVIEFSHFSFGGEVPILIRMRNPQANRRSATPEVVVIEGMGTAPAGHPRLLRQPRERARHGGHARNRS